MADIWASALQTYRLPVEMRPADRCQVDFVSISEILSWVSIPIPLPYDSGADMPWIPMIIDDDFESDEWGRYMRYINMFPQSLLKSMVFPSPFQYQQCLHLFRSRPLLLFLITMVVGFVFSAALAVDSLESSSWLVWRWRQWHKRSLSRAQALYQATITWTGENLGYEAGKHKIQQKIADFSRQRSTFSDKSLATIKTLQTSISTLHHEKESLEASLVVTSYELGHAQRYLDFRTDQAARKLDERQQQLQEAIHEKSTLEYHQEQLIERHQIEILDLRTTIALLEQERDAQEATVASSKRLVLHARTTIDDLYAQRAEGDARLKVTKESLQGEIDRLAGRVRELERLLGEARETVREKEERYGEMEKRYQQIKAKAKALKLYHEELDSPIGIVRRVSERSVREARKMGFWEGLRRGSAGSRGSGKGE